MAVSKVVSLNLSQNGPLEVKVTHVKVKVALVKVKLALVKLKVTFVKVKVALVKVKVISLSLSQNGPCFQNTNLLDTDIFAPLVASSVGKRYRTSTAQTGSSKILKYIFDLLELTPVGHQTDSTNASSSLMY